MKSKLLCGLLISLLSFNSYSQFFNSGNKNLVVKDTTCKSPPMANLYGTIVNRGNTPSEGLLNIKIYDSDNDIVFQRTENYRVLSENGSRFVLQIDIGDCVKPYRYILTLTECKIKPLREGCE
jgi:hypothetical protein